MTNEKLTAQYKKLNHDAHVAARAYDNAMTRADEQVTGMELTAKLRAVHAFEEKHPDFVSAYWNE